MTVFLSSALLVVYVLAGYPLLVMLWARVRPRPIVKRPTERSVSVLLPVHNGEPWIGAKLASLAALDYPRHLLQIIVVSDGSSDRTVEIARAFTGVTVIEIARAGKPAGLNAALARASGEILFLTDVRQRLDPACLRHLVACFADPSVGVVSGELVFLSSATSEQADIGVYWAYEKRIRAAQSSVGSVPGATGAIYAMRRELAVVLPQQALLDDVYLPLAAFFRGFRIVWEPSARAFDYPAALASEFRRKVRTLAGVYQIVGFFPAILAPVHGLWIHFLSHKLGRLLVPYALIALAASTPSLPAPLAWSAGCAQAGFYALAAADRWIPERFPMKRFSSPARTFVVLMAAGVAALSILVRPAQRLWGLSDAR